MSSRFKKLRESALQLENDLVQARQGQTEEVKRRQDAERLKQGLEGELATALKEVRKLKKKNKTYSEKMTVQKAKFKKLSAEKKVSDARSAFFSGEGASKLVKNLLSSSQFMLFMAKACNSVLDQGSTLAFQEIKRLHPEIEVIHLKGYNEEAGENLNVLMSNLSAGRVRLPIEDFIPFFPGETVSASSGPPKTDSLVLNNASETRSASQEKEVPSEGANEKEGPSGGADEQDGPSGENIKKGALAEEGEEGEEA